MDNIELSFKLNVGQPGVDDDPFNPLSRAFRRLMGEGRPHESHVLCFYFSEESELRNDPMLRWLGVLVLSAGNRIIFFPGLSEMPNWIQTTTQGQTSARQSFNLDHISLEAHRQRWHFTTPGSSDHLEGGRTQEIGEGRLSWFGLSVASGNTLRKVSSTTVAMFPSPPSDVQRRLDHLRDTQSVAPHHSVSLMDGSRGRFEEGFPHFCFTAIPETASIYEGPNWLIPSGSPSLVDPFPRRIPDFQVRFHRVALPGPYDVQISCMWLPGTLAIPGVWTTHHSA